MAWVAPRFWVAAAPMRKLLLPSVLRRRSEIHLHFGCGSIADPRFVNIDARAMPHVHLVTQSPMLEFFEPETADSIYACHVFEHLTFRDQNAVLGRWFQLLKPGGLLRLSVPDFDKLLDIYAASGRDATTIQPMLMGGQDYPGNFHCAIFTERHLSNLLKEAGFVEIATWDPRDLPNWPRDYSWWGEVSLNLTAVKSVSSGMDAPTP